MANQPESNDSSLFPKSDEREDSGLQDILAVAAKIKDGPQEELAESGSEREDSGMILFSAGALSGGEGKSDDDGALFGSFAGGLGAGFGAPVEPISSPDLVPLGGEGSVSETDSPLDAQAKPVEEPKRNPLTALAVVLGLGLVAAGAVYLFSEDKGNTQNQQVQAEMSAKPDGEAAVGKAEPTPDEQPDASAGEVVEPQPAPEPVVEAETEGALLDGEGGDGLLAAAEGDADDPMAQEQGLLDGGSNPVAKSGKWDQGTSSKPASEPVAAEPKPKSEPEPEPIVAPTPEPEPAKTPAGGGGGDDEVDCLLNPDLPKCNTGGSSKPKTEEVLAPKLPEKLDSSALRSGFNTVKSKAKACGSKFGAAGGTKVKIHASIEGASGKVSSVEAKGEHAGTELGKCVEDAVKGATFEKFKKPSQGVDYSMIM